MKLAAWSSVTFVVQPPPEGRENFVEKNSRFNLISNFKLNVKMKTHKERDKI